MTENQKVPEAPQSKPAAQVPPKEPPKGAPRRSPLEEKTASIKDTLIGLQAQTDENTFKINQTIMVTDKNFRNVNQKLRFLENGVIAFQEVVEAISEIVGEEALGAQLDLRRRRRLQAQDDAVQSQVVRGLESGTLLNDDAVVLGTPENASDPASMVRGGSIVLIVETNEANDAIVGSQKLVSVDRIEPPAIRELLVGKVSGDVISVPMADEKGAPVLDEKGAAQVRKITVLGVYAVGKPPEAAAEPPASAPEAQPSQQG